MFKINVGQSIWSLYFATHRGISKSETPTSKRERISSVSSNRKTQTYVDRVVYLKTSFVLVVCCGLAWAILKIKVFMGRQGIAVCIQFRL